MNLLEEAAIKLSRSRYATAFTGAGISVESGIPPFRGKGGLWQTYDPIILDLDFFKSNPQESWTAIKKLFYDFFGKAKPNPAHKALAQMEKQGVVKSIITQNIDNLHQEAGSACVYEFHGTAQSMVCLNCQTSYPSVSVSLEKLPPVCGKCKSVLKPDFIFFGEGIPPMANKLSFEAAEKTDVMLVIGTTGEIMPASMIPEVAKNNGASIIEINPNSSNFTHRISDIFLQDKASKVLPELLKLLNSFQVK